MSAVAAPRARSGTRLAVAALAVALCAAEARGAEGTSRGVELQRIRLEIERLEGRLAQISERRGDQRQNLERLRVEVDLQEKRVAEARTERRLVEERLAELDETIGRLEESLEESRQRLQRGLGTLYRLGGGGLWRSLLTASTVEGSLESRRILRYLSWLQATRVERFRRDRSEIGVRRAERVEQRDRVLELERAESERLARLETLRRRQSEVLAALEREEAELERRAAGLAERQEQLAELLSFLVGRRPESIGGLPIQRFKGVLDWPVEGRVVQGFGPRLDRRYRTKVPHNGISLEPEEASEVRSIYPGVVVFAEDFEGFGITVVVHHAERVFTLYSGLASARVVAQDVVSSGQVVGRAADRLYFEVRVEDRPEDPLEWLR